MAALECWQGRVGKLDGRGGEVVIGRCSQVWCGGRGGKVSQRGVEEVVAVA